MSMKKNSMSWKLRKPSENNMSTDIKLTKTQISKIIPSGGFLGLLLSKIVAPLMKLALLFAKNILATLGITAAVSVINTGVQNKIHGSGTTNLIISNKEMNDCGKLKNWKMKNCSGSWRF